MAIIADLLGPKIRFRIDPEIRVSVGDPFRIELEKTISKGKKQTVYLDDKPLKTRMDAEDRE